MIHTFSYDMNIQQNLQIKLFGWKILMVQTSKKNFLKIIYRKSKEQQNLDLINYNYREYSTSYSE